MFTPSAFSKKHTTTDFRYFRDIKDSINKNQKNCRAPIIELHNIHILFDTIKFEAFAKDLIFEVDEFLKSYFTRRYTLEELEPKNIIVEPSKKLTFKTKITFTVDYGLLKDISLGPIFGPRVSFPS